MISGLALLAQSKINITNGQYYVTKIEIEFLATLGRWKRCRFDGELNHLRTLYTRSHFYIFCNKWPGYLSLLSIINDSTKWNSSPLYQTCAGSLRKWKVEVFNMWPCPIYRDKMSHNKKKWIALLHNVAYSSPLMGKYKMPLAMDGFNPLSVFSSTKFKQK